MMNLKDQCCTKEQALRLVELGVKPEALFWHIEAKSSPHGESIKYGWTSEAIVPAFGVAELGDILPNMDLVRKCEPNDWWVSLGGGKIEIDIPTEAQARAIRLIYLLENEQMDISCHWRQNPNDAAEVLKVKKAKEAM